DRGRMPLQFIYILRRIRKKSSIERFIAVGDEYIARLNGLFGTNIYIDDCPRACDAAVNDAEVRAFTTRFNVRSREARSKTQKYRLGRNNFASNSAALRHKRVERPGPFRLRERRSVERQQKVTDLNCIPTTANHTC